MNDPNGAYVKAPPVTTNLYDEVIPTLYSKYGTVNCMDVVSLITVS